MDSSPASAEVKGSRQAEERETEKKDKDRQQEWRGRGGNQSQTTREGQHAEKTQNVEKHRCWRC